MERRWTLLALLAVILPACTFSIEEEVYPTTPSERPAVEADRPVPYERYLVLMDGDQRQAFFELRTVKAKNRFLLEHGLTIRRMLADNLQLGMTTQKVESLLGRPFKERREEHSVIPSTTFKRMVDEWWVYQRPDTGNLVFIPFHRGWVVKWLLEPEIREIVFHRPKNETEREKKLDALIHVQEERPNLLRKPGEEREEYIARMRKVAPTLYSSGPPSWPKRIPVREQAPDIAKERVNKQEIYGWWGDTPKLYEVPPRTEARHTFGSYTRWTYKRFNGYGYIHYSLYFQDNHLVDWVVETDIGKS